MKNPPNETYIYNPAIKNKDALDVFMCFPAPYYIGMSSLGYLSLFSCLDKCDFINPKRIFSDSTKVNIPNKGLVSFSFSFELDILNIFTMLENLKIPIYKNDRDENIPLIFAGGPVVSANPEPFCDFFDFFIIGDGEHLLLQVVKEYINIKHLPRKEQLEKLSCIEGVYVPELFNISYNDDDTIKEVTPIRPDLRNHVCKVTNKVIDECIHSTILTKDTAFSNTYLIEVERGCSQRCFFCLASRLNEPIRWPEKQNVFDTIDKGLIHTRKIGLLGALITEHPDIMEILEYIYLLHKHEPVKLTTSSLRADIINDKLAGILAECNQKQVTISMEAGSEKLRNKLNKKLTNDDIFKCAEICTKNNINMLKMYAMVGLPYEANDDIDSIIELVKSLKQSFNKINITLSLNSFIPKAHTVFDRVELNDFKNSKIKMVKIKKELLKFSKVLCSSSKWDFIQALISRGDRRLSKVLYEAYLSGKTLGSFNNTIRKYMPDAFHQTYRERINPEVLPWQHIRL